MSVRNFDLAENSVAQDSRQVGPVNIPMRPVKLGPRGDIFVNLNDGSCIISSPEPLKAYPRSYTERLQHWASAAPDRVFLAQRAEQSSWSTVTYAEAYSKVRCLSQALLDRGLSSERPLTILSGNSIEHALMGLAAIHVGIPYSPISVGYSLLSRDFAKLRHVINLLNSGMAFVSSLDPFERALAAALPEGVELACVDPGQSKRSVTSYSSLAGTTPTQRVDLAARAVNGDTVAKILFTSGSSSLPKGVINTHRMLCCNQQMAAQAWPFLGETPPVIVDWLPWNHTFGGNHVFGLCLYHGGSFYIDDGKALPGEVEKCVRNLRDVAPTVYFGVPKMYEMLLPFMESDEAFRKNFFSRMQMIFYAAAGMPRSVWDGLRQRAIETTGVRIFTTSTMGSTETSPLTMTANWDADRPNILGLPVAGAELKLVPNGRKRELRVRGPHVTRGYWKQPELTAKAFDNEGWYCIGDALRFADETDLRQGLMFDGRIAEDYKLATGNWVNAGPLRTMANSHLSPLVRDVLPTGHFRNEIGLLIFPEIEACRRLAQLPAYATAREILAHEAVRSEFQKRLDQIAAEGTSSANTVMRIMLIDEPLVDVELTDKSTVSFNVVLERRAADIVELYEDSASPRILRANLRVRA
jgi:feruloyl-CoA synthase